MRMAAASVDNFGDGGGSDGRGGDATAAAGDAAPAFGRIGALGIDAF